MRSVFSCARSNSFICVFSNCRSSFCRFSVFLGVARKCLAGLGFGRYMVVSFRWSFISFSVGGITKVVLSGVASSGSKSRLAVF